MSMQPLILPFKGAVPRIHESAWIAPNATIIGDVVIGPDSSVFYGCVLRGDVGPIRIGARTNIQDNSTVHVDGDAPCTIGDDVTVGHMALLHGTTVHDGTLVGMKAALLSHSVVGGVAHCRWRDCAGAPGDSGKVPGRRCSREGSPRVE